MTILKEYALKMYASAMMTGDINSYKIYQVFYGQYNNKCYFDGYYWWTIRGVDATPTDYARLFKAKEYSVSGGSVGMYDWRLVQSDNNAEAGHLRIGSDGYMYYGVRVGSKLRLYQYTNTTTSSLLYERTYTYARMDDIFKLGTDWYALACSATGPTIYFHNLTDDTQDANVGVTSVSYFSGGFVYDGKYYFTYYLSSGGGTVYLAYFNGSSITTVTTWTKATLGITWAGHLTPMGLWKAGNNLLISLTNYTNDGMVFIKDFVNADYTPTLYEFPVSMGWIRPIVDKTDNYLLTGFGYRDSTSWNFRRVTKIGSFLKDERITPIDITNASDLWGGIGDLFMGGVINIGSDRVVLIKSIINHQLETITDIDDVSVNEIIPDNTKLYQDQLRGQRFSFELPIDTDFVSQIGQQFVIYDKQVNPDLNILERCDQALVTHDNGGLWMDSDDALAIEPAGVNFLSGAFTVTYDVTDNDHPVFWRWTSTIVSDDLIQWTYPYPFTGSERQFEIEFDFRHISIGASDNSIIIGAYQAMLLISNNIITDIYGGGINAYTLPDNEWCHVKIIINDDTDSYDIFFNGMIVAKNILTSFIANLGMTDGVDLNFHTFAGGNNTDPFGMIIRSAVGDIFDICNISIKAINPVQVCDGIIDLEQSEPVDGTYLIVDGSEQDFKKLVQVSWSADKSHEMLQELLDYECDFLDGTIADDSFTDWAYSGQGTELRKVIQDIMAHDLHMFQHSPANVCSFISDPLSGAADLTVDNTNLGDPQVQTVSYPIAEVRLTGKWNTATRDYLRSVWKSQDTSLDSQHILVDAYPYIDSQTDLDNQAEQLGTMLKTQLKQITFELYGEHVFYKYGDVVEVCYPIKGIGTENVDLTPLTYDNFLITRVIQNQDGYLYIEAISAFIFTRGREAKSQSLPEVAKLAVQTNERLDKFQSLAYHDPVTVTASRPLRLSTQLISVANDVNAEITEIDTGTLDTSDTKIPTNNTVKEYVDLPTMIGSANKTWVPCLYMNATNNAYWCNDAAGVINAASSPSSYLCYQLPLPTNRGGLKLYVKKMRITLAKASASYYVNRAITWGNDSSAHVLKDTGATNNMKAAGSDEWAMATDPTDVSSYMTVTVWLDCIVGSTADQIKIYGVELEVYYA